MDNKNILNINTSDKLQFYHGMYKILKMYKNIYKELDYDNIYDIDGLNDLLDGDFVIDKKLLDVAKFHTSIEDDINKYYIEDNEYMNDMNMRSMILEFEKTLPYSAVIKKLLQEISDQIVEDYKKNIIYKSVMIFQDGNNIGKINKTFQSPRLYAIRKSRIPYDILHPIGEFDFLADDISNTNHNEILEIKNSSSNSSSYNSYEPYERYDNNPNRTVVIDNPNQLRIDETANNTTNNITNDLAYTDEQLIASNNKSGGYNIYNNRPSMEYYFDYKFHNEGFVLKNKSYDFYNLIIIFIIVILIMIIYFTYSTYSVYDYNNYNNYNNSTFHEFSYNNYFD